MPNSYKVKFQNIYLMWIQCGGKAYIISSIAHCELET